MNTERQRIDVLDLGVSLAGVVVKFNLEKPMLFRNVARSSRHGKTANALPQKRLRVLAGGAFRRRANNGNRWITYCMNMSPELRQILTKTISNSGESCIHNLNCCLKSNYCSGETREATHLA